MSSSFRGFALLGQIKDLILVKILVNLISESRSDFMKILGFCFRFFLFANLLCDPDKSFIRIGD